MIRSPAISLLAMALTAGFTFTVTAHPQKTTPEVNPAGLTTDLLDHLTRLPGGLSALPAPPIPARNPQTAEKIALGRLLFFDKRLSLDRSMSCATCHDPGKGYSDGRAKAVGIGHTTLGRRSPSLLNGAYNSLQFWDGRAKSLEDQALVPMLSKSEMGMPGQAALLARLKQLPEYRQGFRKAFGREMTLVDVSNAIAAFERTLVTRDSPFDLYVAGNKRALTEQQKRGLILFFGKASCTQCHNGPNFTDNKLHSLGTLPDGSDGADLGQFLFNKNPADRNKFKTPSLRSSSQQSRFMHNGSFESLAQVIEFYDQGGGAGAKSNLLFPLQLTVAEKSDLLAFLSALAGHVAN